MPLTLLGCGRFDLQGVWSNGAPIITTWHARVAETTNRVTAIRDAAAIIGTHWISHVVPLMPNNYSVSNVHYMDLNSLTGVTGDFPLEPAGVGANPASSVAPSHGMVIKKTFGDLNRATRQGRLFLPGGNEGTVDEDGLILAAQRDLARTALNAFKTAVHGASTPEVSNVRLVVAHTPSEVVEKVVKYRQAKKEGSMTSDDIDDFVASPYVSGIRRRVKRV
jgi:hypothetical protein